MDKCCICGREAEDVKPYTSTLTKEDRYYCPNCVMSGVEPYEDLVNYGWISDLFCETFRRKVLIPTLQYNNKTIQQFNDEVREKRGW